LDVGYVGVLAAEQTITCGASSTYNYTTLSLTDNYNDGNYASDIYTIPTDGLYKIYLNAESEDTMGYMTKLDFSYDQGTTWESIPIASSNTQYVKMLQEGDKVKLRAGCAYYVGAGGASNDSTIDHTKFAYAIKKF
jgi:formylmethanofuran dehydrogenase subunit A